MEAEPFDFLRSYKDNEPIESIQQLPISSNQRISTDIFCTIISSVFAIGMFIAAIICLDLSSLQRMTYPTDQQGRHCTLDNSNYNYLYFSSSNDPSKRLCVSQCPNGSEQRLNCWPTQNLSCAKNSNTNFQVSIYPSIASQTSLGLFCAAKDKNLNNKLLQNANLSQMYQFVEAYHSLGISFLSAIGFGVLGILLLSFFPGFMTYASIIIGGVGCILSGIFLFIADSAILSVYKSVVIIFGIVVIIAGLILIYASIWRQKDIRITINYLKQASACFWEFPALAGVSLVFILLLIGLVVLCGFQILAFWSKSNMHFEPNNVYVHPSGTFPIFMTVLTFIQFIWGLSFLKQAFNLLISGTTVSWYFRQKHSFPFAMGNLFKFHWGSVVAGAFLLHVLYPIDLIYDILKPSQNDRGPYRQFCCCCEKILDLARSEAMILINIVGMPYCNASRWCEKILYHSENVQGNSSPNRFARIGGHIALALLSTFMGYIYMKGSGNVSVLALLLSFLINIFTLSFFICLIKDMVESIYFCTVLDQYYQNADNQSVAKKLFPEGYEVFPTQ